MASSIKRRENLLISLRETDPIVKRGLLPTYVGETTTDTFDTLPSTGTYYAAAIESLTQRFDPSTNIDMEMKEQDIIGKVDVVTPWLSPLIPIPKKGGDIRLVLEVRVRNQALERRISYRG